MKANPLDERCHYRCRGAHRYTRKERCALSYASTFFDPSVFEAIRASKEVGEYVRDQQVYGLMSACSNDTVLDQIPNGSSAKIVILLLRLAITLVLTSVVVYQALTIRG